MHHKPQYTPIADGCCRDVSRQYLREDGVWCFIEWTPTLNLDKPLDFDGCKALAESCQLAGGGWRSAMPAELASVVDYNKEFPAIDTSVPTFADTRTDRIYWTGNVDPSSPSVSAFCVNFNDGYVFWNYQSHGGFVRAYRLVPASQ